MAALLCAVAVAATVLSLVKLESSLPVLRALEVDAHGLWLVLGLLLEGCLEFLFWAGVCIVFSRTKRIP
jgi:hypothetical protein